MAVVNVYINNRIASVEAGVELVCNNPTDTIQFTFDEEWTAHSAKTARFSWEGKYIDVPFEGNQVETPEIFRTNYVYVGVYADDISSTPAKVPCRYSIKCLNGANTPPSKDVYTELLGLVNDRNTLTKNGILGRWVLAENVCATLYDDGTFVVSGTGTAPAYSVESAPPWRENQYLSSIKKIVFDENVTYSSLGGWFDSADLRPCGIVAERIDIPSTVRNTPVSSFRGIRANHINYARCTSMTTISNFRMEKGAHMIMSIPATICTESVISQMCSKITDTLAITSRSEVLVIITDSIALRDAVYTVMHDSTVNTLTATQNFTVIYCEELGIDGFPSYWTQSMKRVLPEILPYIGRQFVYFDNNGTWHADGLTSLSTYGSVGWPNMYSFADPDPENGIEERFNLFYYVNGSSLVKHSQPKVSTYIAQPYSTSLDNLSSGLRCAGFVNWLYWRYFGENFTLASTFHMFQAIGRFDQPLPLQSIESEDELSYFDIVIYAKLNDDGSNSDGHASLYMGKMADGRIRVLESNYFGISFATFNVPDGYAVRFYRLNKNAGLSYGLLKQN